MTLRDRSRANNRDGMNHIAMLIVEHDKYLKTYPNSMVIDNVRSKRNWLREKYFLESTCVELNSHRSDEKFVAESFNDVIQFYPGTELEKITQTFLELWSPLDSKKSSVLRPFILFYDEGFESTSLVLDETVTANGLVLPKLNGAEYGEDIEFYLELKLEEHKNRYVHESMKDWKFIQDYDIVYLDQKHISVVLNFNLTHPSFPNLSIRDIEGHTFSFEDGKMLSLEEMLPVDQESFTHLFADVEIYAGKNDFDMSGVTEDWKDVYLTKEGIVIYKGGVLTGHSAEILTIPNEAIAEWIN